MSDYEAGEITRILQQGEGADWERLLPIVYEELRSMATAIFRSERIDHTLQPTALVHEAYLRLIGQNAEVSWQNRAHFFGVAARLMRQLLVNHANAHNAEKRSGQKTRVTLNNVADFSKFQNLEILELHDALEKLAALDERQAKIVELRFFGGLTLEETAEVMQASVMKVRREWKLAKMWLYKMLDNS